MSKEGREEPKGKREDGWRKKMCDETAKTEGFEDFGLTLEVLTSRLISLERGARDRKRL